MPVRQSVHGGGNGLSPIGPLQSRDNDTGINSRVCDAAGRPIRGARIWFLDALESRNRLEGVPYALSDEEGRFHVSDLDDQGGFLVVEATGFRPCRTWMNDPSQEVQVTLQRPDQVCTYRVSVVDESGRPLANAPVSLVVTGDPRGTERHEARTDPAGQATFLWQAPDGKDRTGSFGCDLAGYDLAFASPSSAAMSTSSAALPGPVTWGCAWSCIRAASSAQGSSATPGQAHCRGRGPPGGHVPVPRVVAGDGTPMGQRLAVGRRGGPPLAGPRPTLMVSSF